MIDPNAVTHFSRTDRELEEFALFCVVVAGKNADQQSRKLEDFLEGNEPFPLIRSLAKKGSLEARLKRVKLGKYSLLDRSFRALAGSGADLRTCDWRGLTAFPGIGIKTSKFFILHSRAGEMHGVLDTHVLNWMRRHWELAGPRQLAVPRHSPQDPAAYVFWETVYFGMIAATRHPGRGEPIDWAKVDLDLWKQQRAK